MDASSGKHGAIIRPLPRVAEYYVACDGFFALRLWRAGGQIVDVHTGWRREAENIVVQCTI